jgi:hypothetical protein
MIAIYTVRFRIVSNPRRNVMRKLADLPRLMADIDLPEAHHQGETR